MNCTGSKELVTALEPRQPRVPENEPAGLLADVKRVAVLGSANAALALRLLSELERSVPKETISTARGLAHLRELVTTCAPSVIFFDSDLLGGLPLLDAVRPLAALAPVLVLAPLNAQADIAKLVADERVDFVARVGDFVPLAAALITRRLKQPHMSNSASGAPERTAPGIGDIFRHEINNPLTGILGNAELVLAHREHFSGVQIQRLQTVVDLAVRLRENIRRISNTWEERLPPQSILEFNSRHPFILHYPRSLLTVDFWNFHALWNLILRHGVYFGPEFPYHERDCEPRLDYGSRSLSKGQEEMPPSSRFVVIEPNGTRREVPIVGFPFRIGRQAENELTLRDSRISRQQAQVLQTNGAFVLEDMGSRHGTFVNGQKVVRHELRPNDAIEFGVADSYRLIFMSEGATIEDLVGRVEAPAPAASGSRELYHLGVLLDVARALGTGLSLEDILTVVVDAAIQVTQTERGVLLLTSPSGELQTIVARNAQKSTLRPEDLQVSRSVVKRVVASRRELIVSDTGDDFPVNPQESMARLALRTVVAIPIDKLPVIESVDATIAVRQGELLGVLYLDSRAPTSAFSSVDREVLRTLAREAATVVENARLFASSRDKARLDHEIQIASEIQQRLLPKSLPDLPEVAIAGSTLACYSVGGDCFDVIELGAGRRGFFVGDVSGKGISAALLATLLQGVFFTTAAMDIPICDIFSRVNKYLSERTQESRYATVFYGVLDRDGSFEYVNAGHVPPLLRRQSGALEPLASANFPVGLFAEAEYQSARVKLARGEFLVIYTDGVSEAANTRNEQFEETRLRKILEESPARSVDEIADSIREGVKNFTQGAPQSDDITVLVIQYKSEPA